MSLRIGTNVASLMAQHQLEKSSQQKERAIKALASGQRLSEAGQDAAGFAIAENLRAQWRALEQGRRNAGSATALIQVAEGGLNEQNNILIRLRELAIQSASDTVSDTEREYLQTEAVQLVAELDRIAESTTYGTKSLLAGEEQELEFHIGAHSGEENIIRYQLEADARTDALGVNGLDIADQDEARDALGEIDRALQSMAEMRSSFGAMQSRLMSSMSHLGDQIESIASARSLIADTDIAAETARMVQADILQSTGVAVLAQANQIPRHAERLLHGI